MRLLHLLLFSWVVSAYVYVPAGHRTPGSRRVSTVIIPGFGVSPDSYKPIARCIRDEFVKRNVTSDVYILRYGMNALHNVQTESLLRSVLSDISPRSDVVCVGHSQGAFSGVEYASKKRIKFVQWAGARDGFRSSPRTPRLLCELDDRVDLMSELNESRENVAVVKGAGHMSGVSDPNFRKEIASAVCALAMPRASARAHEYDPIFEAGKLHRVAMWAEGLQREALGGGYDSDASRVKVHSLDASALTSLASIAFPAFKWLFDACWVFPAFLGSHPTRRESHVYVSREGDAWVKFSGEVCARKLNERTFETALSKVSPEQRSRYRQRGKRMVFVDDIVVPCIPGCGAIWIATPVRYGKKVRSVILRTATRTNAKLLTEAQALRWILHGAFK